MYKVLTCFVLPVSYVTQTLWKALAPEDPCKLKKKRKEKSSDNAHDL